MPFQSEKQRRYMHANLPVIANRWEKKYGLGGVAELNAELNSLPEYYLPKNQGGRIGFDSGSNGITLGSDKYNITLEPGASGSWTSHDLGHGYNVDDKNIAYGVDTTANIGPVEIGVDFKNFLDKFDVTKDGTTVEKDTEKDKQIAYSLGLNLKDLYAKIDSDEEFENFYITIRKTFSGGGTPAHQAGIYGLAEGGRIGFNAGSMLVAPTTDGSRPGYAYDDVEDMGFDDSGNISTTDSSEPTDYGAGNPDQYNTTPPTKAPTPDSDDGDARSKHKLAQSTQKKPDRTGGEQEWGDWVGGSVNQYGKITPYEGYNISDRMELQAIEKAKQQRSSIGKTIGKGILTLASFGLFGPAAAKLASYYKTGEKIHSAYKTGKVNLKGIEVDINKVLDPVKARLNKEIDIDPSGLGYGKDLVDKPVINDTDNGQTNGRTDIQTDIQTEGQNIALKRKQEQEWASYLAQLRQEELNRKKDAYYKNYRQSYMSAKGGRVPGYNTGGLSNLFKLKTA